MAYVHQEPHREVIQMGPHDSFLVFNRTKETFHYPLHFHPEYELNYISNGSGLRRVVGNSFSEIEDKELVLIGSDVPHCWEQHNCEGKKVREITIQFHPTLFHESLLNRGIMKPIKDMLRKSKHGILFSRQVINSIESRLIEVTKLDGFDYFMELVSILYDLAVSRNQTLLSDTYAKKGNGESNEKLSRVHEFIEKNYTKKITLSELAQITNMSPVSFNRFIKKRTGKTFINYLNDVRISKACRLLIEQDESISYIAYGCGFNSIANFNRMFKKSKGCTPTEYRNGFWGVKKVL